MALNKETPRHPNVLLSQIVELEGEYAKFGFITTLHLDRLSKIKRKPNILFDNLKEITLARA